MSLSEKAALRRYLIDPELRGAELPDWYALIRAARYLGVPPWDLLKKPAAYLHWALVAEQAENEAQDAIAKRNQSAS